MSQPAMKNINADFYDNFKLLLTEKQTIFMCLYYLILLRRFIIYTIKLVYVTEAHYNKIIIIK